MIDLINNNLTFIDVLKAGKNLMIGALSTNFGYEWKEISEPLNKEAPTTTWFEIPLDENSAEGDKISFNRQLFVKISNLTITFFGKKFSFNLSSKNEIKITTTNSDYTCEYKAIFQLYGPAEHRISLTSTTDKTKKTYRTNHSRSGFAVSRLLSEEEANDLRTKVTNLVTTTDGMFTSTSRGNANGVPIEIIHLPGIQQTWKQVYEKEWK